MKSILITLFFCSIHLFSKCQLTYVGTDNICSGSSFFLKAEGDTTFKWVLASKPDSVLSYSAIFKDTIYEFTSYLLIGTSDTVEVNVFVSDCLEDISCQYYVPNVFTPDGDVFNEVFKPIINCDYWGAHLTIYNRNQKVIYDVQENDPVWDGIDQRTGNPALQGIYIWQFSFAKTNGEVVHLVGHVLLSR
ncbi:gliding motility-associated C-terminal domain-containing protein [Paracrocinitomix mangrovi]|uniref:T9SS type B sorting domain-containing protein n=1 Tax=Paracrocinitomix mangrovi TaxID=2862509 RepID=UPI001C8DCF43|nr:gliding motility-associated C-terminal domain-containing protein [Paracrocinitomix mangrovi]UKN03080.1 gliding motility-associated C-terminal domain-containing protein [Paracrocinitomix mangrovi]